MVILVARIYIYIYIFLLLLAAVYVKYVYTIQYFMYNYVNGM